MSATLLVVELLIIGFQALALLALLVGVVFHSSVSPYTSPEGLKQWLKDWTPLLKEWMPLLVMGMFATTYTLGLVWDRLIGLLGPSIVQCFTKIGDWMARMIRVLGRVRDWLVDLADV